MPCIAETAGFVILSKFWHSSTAGIALVPKPIVEFGDFRLDCGRSELTRAGRLLKLERKPTDLLILLAARDGELITVPKSPSTSGAARFSSIPSTASTPLSAKSARPSATIPITPASFRPSPAAATALSARSPPFSQSPRRAALRLHRRLKYRARNHWEPLHLPPTRPSRARSRLWLLLGSLAALLLVVITITLQLREHTTHAATPTIQSIAVLPLNNLSGDPAQDYFADGMTDELTTMLAKDSTLRVISRTSAMQFKKSASASARDCRHTRCRWHR